MAPLRLGTIFPALPQPEQTKRPRVYIVGYPGRRELSFSFHDNEVLDHEVPIAGKPKCERVVRLHYCAPTEGGSSSSPVFDETGWTVIALRHSGGQRDMPQLNGVAGIYAANEGLAMGSLLVAARAALAARPAEPPSQPR